MHHINLECYDKRNNYSDNYYGTKYGKYPWSKVKHLGKHLATSKVRHPYIIKHLPDKLYNNDILFTKLCRLYQDFDVNVKNVLDGANNQMFLRFAAMFGIFKNEEHYEVAINCWDEGFSTAMGRYYRTKHKEYDDTLYNVSYIAHYDLTFSNYLYYAVGFTDQRFNAVKSYYQGYRFKGVHSHRFSWLDDQEVSELNLVTDQYTHYLQKKDSCQPPKLLTFSPQVLSIR